MSPLPPLMRVACDMAVFRVSNGRLEILLVERGNDPYKGLWALPGGFVELGEDLPDTAARELEEETGLRPVAMDQVGAWGTPDRDPRGRTVGVVYAAVARPGLDKVQGGDDAASAAWHPLGTLSVMAFDHALIVPASLAHLKRRCERTHTLFALVDDVFSIDDLARALRALGSHDPPQGARRLLQAAEPAAAGSGRYRLSAIDYLAPLRETVVLFPAI